MLLNPLNQLNNDVLTTQQAHVYLLQVPQLLKSADEAIRMGEDFVNNSSASKAERDAMLEQVEMLRKIKVILLDKVAALRSCIQGKDLSDTPSRANTTLSSPSGELNDAGIGVVVAGSVLALVGLVAAVLPFIGHFLPPQLRGLLGIH